MPLLVGTAIQNLPMACRHNISSVIKIGQNHDLAARANGARLCRFKHAKPFAERDLLVVADRLVGKDQDRMAMVCRFDHVPGVFIDFLR